MAARDHKPRDKRRVADLLNALEDAEFDQRSQRLRDIVNGLRSDSRTVEAGDVFVAVRGTEVDGHRFVEDAEKRGAIACVTEQPVRLEQALNIVVEDSAKALSLLASSYYGDPSVSLRMVGVTGTNGKTSTTHLFRAICEKSQRGSVGLIGTVGHGAGPKLQASVHTTPEPITLHRLLGDMKDQGCSGVVMEVSSHAVRQQRTWGIDFEIGMLTNVTRDHLDYHSSFEDYLAAKREFCYSLIGEGRRKDGGVLIYSRDNENSCKIGDEFPGRKISTGVESEADVFASDIAATLKGTSFKLHFGKKRPIKVNLKLLGSFTVSNALLAAAAANAMKISGPAITEGLESVESVPGRFQALGGDARPVVIVDYSHTPDSLELTLEFCRGLNPRRLITVFGCGGDRDRGKRPLMGEIAERLSDLTFVTSDNPRTEDPQAIIEEILTGMNRGAEGLHVEVDRRKAIHSAVEIAEVGDIVTICGKGHEDYQIIGTTLHHFDDREEAAAALDAWR